MTDVAARAGSSVRLARMAHAIESANGLLARFPASIVQLLLRIALAVPFWRSGLTRWDGFGQISEATLYLFAEEFRLHVFGGTFPFPFPKLIAYLTATAEIALPILLVLGLATRFSALGILVMTAIIQLTVPDGWANFHLPWAAMALAVIVHGPGRLALDHWLARFASSGK